MRVIQREIFLKNLHESWCMLLFKLARVIGGDPVEQLLGQVATMER